MSKNHKTKIDISENSYKLAVENLAHLRTPQWFANKGPKHAVLCVTQIFKQAKKRIYIFSETLNYDVTSDVTSDVTLVSALSTAIYKNNVEICLVLETPLSNIEHKSDALNIIIEAKNAAKNIHIHNAIEHPQFLEALKKRFENEIPHIIIGDEDMIRIETDKSNYTASVNFNEPYYVNEMLNIFRKIC